MQTKYSMDRQLVGRKTWRPYAKRFHVSQILTDRLDRTGGNKRKEHCNSMEIRKG